jgi:hypothetical protein
MDRGVKRVIERTFGDSVWIEKATPLGDVAALIARLRPRVARAGLIRFGGATDGGYLLPDDLDGVAACLSPGVANECSFDEQMAARGIDVFMADASVDGPPRSNPRFQFVRKFVDISTTETTMTLEALAPPASAAGAEGDLILQMDIEGAEYRVLASTPDEFLRRFRIMVIEFHCLDQLFSRFAFNFMRPVFEKLARLHNVVHIHPNNCTRVVNRGPITIPPVMEFTFYRRDRPLADASTELRFPHPLDADCVAHHPTIALPDCWWRGTDI